MWLTVTKEKMMKGKAPQDERTVTNKQDPPLKRQYDMEGIPNTPECPRMYVMGKPFVPDRILERLPCRMRMFHD
jgi:hypothetical protein